MAKSWTICLVNLKHISSFSNYLPSMELRNSEPGKKPRATFYVINAIIYCLAPLHRAVSTLNVAFCLNISPYVLKLLCKD